MDISNILTAVGICGVFAIGIGHVACALILELGCCGDGNGSGDMDDLDCEEHYDDMDEA